jgi:hypothetical protein
VQSRRRSIGRHRLGVCRLRTRRVRASRSDLLRVGASSTSTEGRGSAERSAVKSSAGGGSRMALAMKGSVSAHDARRGRGWPTHASRASRASSPARSTSSLRRRVAKSSWRSGKILRTTHRRRRARSARLLRRHLCMPTSDVAHFGLGQAIDELGSEAVDVDATDAERSEAALSAAIIVFGRSSGSTSSPCSSAKRSKSAKLNAHRRAARSWGHSSSRTPRRLTPAAL